MVKKIVLGLSLVALSSLSAEDMFSQHAVGAKVGTLGFGAEYTTNLTDSLDLRLGINAYNYSTSDTAENIDYDIDAKFKTFSALIDYHPMDNGLILSGGLIINGNKGEFKAQATGGTYTINGVTYNASDIGSLDGELEYDDIAPYIGIGYSTKLKSSGFHFTADLGVMYQGAADTSLNVQCGSGLTAGQCATLRADVEAEKKEFDDEVSNYKWYPILNIGVAYRF